MVAARKPAHAAALSRRRVVSLGAGALAGGLLLPGAALAQRRRGEAALDYAPPDAAHDLALGLEPTGACATPGDPDAPPTERQTEGPFYSPRTPHRADFSADGAGASLVLVGRVVSTDCRPLPNVALDFWHADSEGRYDNQGYRFRGHQFTDGAGAFRLATIRPSGYGSAGFARPPHIHVKLQGHNTQLLTTQLYFPDQENAPDRIFREGLVMRLSREGEVWLGRFDFVLPTA